MPEGSVVGGVTDVVVVVKVVEGRGARCGRRRRRVGTWVVEVGVGVVGGVGDVGAVVVGARVVEVVDDVGAVVVGARVVEVVDDVEVEVVAPLSVTLITFDGPLSKG